MVGSEAGRGCWDGSSADWELVDELVFACLEHEDSERDAALDRACREHPAVAERVRRCLARIDGAGLTPRGEGAESFGGFRVLSRLGGGGMGVVDLALQQDLDRLVALKRIRPEMLASEKARERFVREARAAGRIAHPAICPLYEAGEHSGVPYLVMPFLHGETMARRIAVRAQRTPGDAVRTTAERRAEVLGWVEMFETIARGLHVAHESGLVHRDVKPGNVMITDEGQPVILDFGLARDTSSDDPSLTASGALVGTLPYMAPEQLADDTRAIDRRTDIYALGVSLYEALTGRLPFEARARDSLHQQVRRGVTTHARSLNREIPRDLEVVVETAMDPDRERRYPTALAFAEDLARVRAREPIAARPAGVGLRLQRWTQRHPALATLIALLAVGLASSVGLLAQVAAARSDAERSLVRSEALRLAREASIAERTDAVHALELALAADETEPLLETHSQLNHALQASRLCWKSTPVRGHAEHAVFSADGRRLLIVSGGGTVQLWEAASGSWAGDEPRLVAQRELADYDFPAAAKTGATQFGLSAAALSPDGRTAVVGGSYKHAFVWRPDGEPALVALGAREAERGPGGEELLKRDGHAGQVMGIALSEDLGRVWTATWTGRLLEWQLDGPEPRATELIRRAGANWTGLRGLEDGSLLLWGVVTGAAGATMDTVRVSDRGEKLGSWSLPAAARAIYPRPVAVSLATRRVVAASAGTAGLWDLDDGTRIPLPGRDVGHFMAGLSPDGAIAATADSDGRVRLSDAEDGAFRIELSALARAVRGLCFAPDSRRVVVANTDLELLVYGIDGVLQQRLNGSGHDSIAGLGFSPDGSFLTLGGGDGVVRVWDLSSARRPVAISTGYLEPGRLAVAPDGRVVAFATGDDRIWRWELDTGEVTPIGQHVGTDSVRFTADGRVLSGGGGRDPRLSQAMLWGDDPTEPVWRMPPAAQFIGVSVAEVPTRNAVLVALGRNYVKPPEVQVWSLDAAATAPLRVLRGPDAMPRINHADVSPDGTRVAVAGFDGLVRVWDLGLDEGGPVERVASDEVRFEPRGGPVQHVRFDPSGTRVVFGCGDGTVHIGSLADGSAMSLTGHTKRTVGVRFADDGRLVLSGSMDGTARVWDASTGAELCRFDIGASSGVWDVGWIPARDGNGPRVVAASADGRLSTWIVDRAELHGMARAAILR